MALIDQFIYSTDSGLQQKVLMAMCAAAIAIQSEALAVLLKVDAAAAATTITPVSVTGFATGDLVQFGTSANAETRSITISGANFTVTALTNAHKAGEVIQKVLYNSVNRRNYAKLILNNPDTYKQLFCDALCSNDATFITATPPTDTQINNAVSAVFSALAGTV